MRQLRKTTGFSLLELLIVVFIITIFAGIALPNYTRSIERARMRDAESKLNLVFHAQRIYRLDNGSYGAANDVIGTSYCPSLGTNEFAFSITLGNPANGYTATATRRNGGTYNDSTISLTNDFQGAYTYTGQYNANGNPS